MVEDNADVREVTTAMIEDLGYSVIAADGPAQALDLLRQHPVSLIFSDIVMPGPITARQMAERAAALCPGVKVLFTSGHAEMAEDQCRARAEARPGEQAVPPRRAGAPFAPRVVPCRVQPGLAERA